MDSEPSVLVAKWHCAKNAFVTIMRSWTGVIQLTSDELGLSTLVRMLRDTKVTVCVSVCVCVSVYDCDNSRRDGRKEREEQKERVEESEADRDTESYRDSLRKREKNAC